MNDELKKLREQIDSIDDDLVKIVSKRFDIVREVGKLKKDHKIELWDQKRLEELLKTKKEKAKLLGISQSFVEKLFKLIHEHSIEVQKKL